MNNTIIIFSDEAGQYYKLATPKNINSAPFYVRSGVFISTEDYKIFQEFTVSLKKHYDIPLTQEIKWSDIYEIQKNRYRDEFLKSFNVSDIKNYIQIFLKNASELKSIKYVFTITKNSIHNFADNDYMLFTHLQNIYQRAQKEADMKNMNVEDKNDFFIVIIDDMDSNTLKKLREKCSNLFLYGDRFIEYKNVNQSLLVENSKQSAGIQLADYSAGIFNSVAKKYILSMNGYDYADEMYSNFIAPNVRNLNGKILGYGLMKITNKNKCYLDDLVKITEKRIKKY